MRTGTRAVLLAALLVALAALLWFSRRVLLLVFSGMLISLVFTSSVNQLRRLFPLRQGLGVGLVLVIFLGLAALTGYMLAPGLSSEFSDLAKELPESFHRAVAKLEGTPLYQRFRGALPEPGQVVSSSGKVVSHVTSVFSSTLEGIAALFLLMFVALFLAANPPLYKNLVLNLVSPKYRSDAAQVLTRVICTLKFWLLGQFISMCIIGALVGVSFKLCGLPLSASLGVLAGIGEFVPFVGPLLAAIPAMILAVNVSGKLFLIVVAVYVAIQFLEGHLIMPLVQRHTVDLPPVLTLVALFFMGNAFGLLGMFVAAPLTGMALILVEELYLHRFLGDNSALIQRE